MVSSPCSDPNFDSRDFNEMQIFFLRRVKVVISVEPAGDEALNQCIDGEYTYMMLTRKPDHYYRSCRGQ